MKQMIGKATGSFSAGSLAHDPDPALDPGLANRAPQKIRSMIMIKSMRI
jgi:hypothetical protein